MDCSVHPKSEIEIIFMFTFDIFWFSFQSGARSSSGALIQGSLEPSHGFKALNSPGWTPGSTTDRLRVWLFFHYKSTSNWKPFFTCKSGIFSKKPFGKFWIWFPLRFSFHKFLLFLNVSELKFEIMLSAAFSLFMQYLKTL